ncbi:hypothetical protein BASA81_001088 [Batrachochytrium salamandrivorans]|nr:hypothetical protein BASA81_001088 [Batrachochytrium salamandrivorans]
MKVAVYGSGCIGASVGILLATQGHAVRFIYRDSSKYEQIASLVLQTPSGDTVTLNHPNLTADPGLGLSNCDVVFVATKRFSNPIVRANLAQFAPPGALVILLQNGLGAKRDFDGLEPSLIVIESVVSFNVVAGKPGQFHWVTPQKDSCIVLDGGSNGAARDSLALRVCEAVEKSGVKCLLDDQFAQVSTGKVVLNMINAPNALSGVTLDKFFVEFGYRLVWAQAILEALQVFAAMGVPHQRSAGGGALADLQLSQMHRILIYSPDWLVHVLAKKQNLQGAKASMLQDLENRAESTEVEYLSGAIVRLGIDLGIATPVNAKLVELVNRASAEKQGSPKLSPCELAAAVGLDLPSSSCVLS